MSKFLRLNDNSDTALQTMDHQNIFRNVRPSFYQFEDKATRFTPSGQLEPGARTHVTIKMNSLRELVREEGHFLTYSMKTTDSTNHPTFKMGTYTHFDELIFEINDSRYKIEFKELDFIMEVVGKEALEQGLSIYEYLARGRNEYDTFVGTQVTDASPVQFVYPLAPFINWIRGLVPNGFIDNIKLSVRVTNPTSSAKDTALVCVSNTNANPYTASAIQINELEYARTFTIIDDTRLAGRPPMDRVRIIIPKFEKKVFSNIAWTGGEEYNLKLSEIGKRRDIQYITAFVRKNPTTFNDADAGKRYSGHKHILWGIRELAGLERELDFTDNEHKLKIYELETMDNRYSTKQLDEIWKDTTDLNRYYLNLTNIYFDFNKIEPMHHEIINTLNSDERDFEITFKANSNVGANVDLFVMFTYYDIVQFDSERKLVKV